MSRPDYAIFHRPDELPRLDGFPYRILLRPVDETGRTVMRGAFAIEPGCAGEALNDLALDHYLEAKVPVMLFARRAGDLRPFMRRTESFLQRGYVVEVLS